jgi:drug/metabolite transporter (DMT)-like permease
LTTSRAALAAAVAALFLWAGGNVIVKLIDLPGLQVAAWRVTGGMVFYLGILRIVGPRQGGRGRLGMRELRLAVPTGLAYGLQTAVFFVAIKATTVANATVISALQPVLVAAVASRRFGEKVDARFVGLVTVALTGVTLVVFGSSGTPVWSLRGDLLAAVACVLWAWYFVAVKRARAELGTLELQAASLVTAAVVLIPVSVVSTGGVDVPDAGTLAGLGVLVLIPGTGHLLMNWAQAHLRLTMSSTLTLALPVLSTVGAALFLDEPVVALQVLGMVVVLLALAVLVRRDTRLSG